MCQQVEFEVEGRAILFTLLPIQCSSQICFYRTGEKRSGRGEIKLYRAWSTTAVVEAPSRI